MVLVGILLHTKPSSVRCKEIYPWVSYYQYSRKFCPWEHVRFALMFPILGLVPLACPLVVFVEAIFLEGLLMKLLLNVGLFQM